MLQFLVVLLPGLVDGICSICKPGDALQGCAPERGFGGEEQEFEIGKETRPENAADSLQKDDPSSFDMDMFPRKDTVLEKLFISVRR